MKRPSPTQNEKSLNENDFIVSKTDLKGRMLYGNKMFIKISGYAEKELLNQPHSMLRHPDMPKIVFKLLWQRIQAKKEIFAYVKNLCKDGSYYWVFANVTATVDEGGNIRDFHSVRRKPSAAAMQIIPALYKKLLTAEKSGGIEASEKLLHETLNTQGVGYDQFVLNLQR